MITIYAEIIGFAQTHTNENGVKMVIARSTIVGGPKAVLEKEVYMTFHVEDINVLEGAVRLLKEIKEQNAKEGA